MRVLVLTMSDFGGQGGIAQYNRDLITAIALHPRTQDVLVLPRQINDLDAINHLPQKVTHVSKAARGKMTYLYNAVLLLSAKPRFDLIIAGHVNLSILAYVLAKRHRAKTSLLLYGVEAWKPSARCLQNRLTRKMAHKVSISHFTGQRYTAWSRQSVSQILPCAIELDRFTPGQKNLAWMRRYGLVGKRIILTLGRLSAAERYKGFDEVIGVLPNLLKKYPDLRYVIAGEGDDRARLMQKVERMRLSESVIFTGYLSETEKQAAYRSSDAFVMPGRGEGFGIVYLEARASGIPVIGSQLDASREVLLDGQIGQCVNPDHPWELEQAIESALHDHERTVPSELQVFSITHFNKRAHAWLDTVYG